MSRDESDRSSRRTDGRTASEAAPDRRDGTSEQCSQCGDAIPSDEWHPVATERDDDGRVEIHDFCSEDCRSAWQTSSSD